MKRGRSKAIEERDKSILAHIKSIKAEHPLWGYRRVWAYLNYRMGIRINKKRVYRIMKENNLLVKKNNRNRAKRSQGRPKPKAKRPNEFWGIDMTKIKVGGWGWLYLVVVLDWYTKEIVGYSLSLRSTSRDWLDALDMAVNNRYPGGIAENRNRELYLVSDNGCQPTSGSFMRTCSLLGVKQIFTSWSNPKGNSDTERVIRTLKEDLLWPNEWDNPFEFEKGLEEWIEKYNNDFPHQSLGYMTPKQFYEGCISNESVLS